MKKLQHMKGGGIMKLAKSIAALLFVMLLTSGVFAVSDSEAKEGFNDFKKIEVTKLSPSSATTNPNANEEELPTEYEEISTTENDDLPVNKISVILDPRKQTSETGTATYKVTIKAYYLQNIDALKVTEYELDFDSEDGSVRGEFSMDEVSLQPGNRATVELKVKTEEIGEHIFTVKAKDSEGNKAKTEGVLSVIDSNTKPSQKVRLDLQPEKKFTETGTSEFEVIVYRPLETPCYSNTECASIYKEQEYELSFVSEQESLRGKFVKSSSILLKPGEKKSMPLEVTAEEKGTYVFKVYAKTQDYETSARGLLVYGKEPTIPSTPSYLEGEGFAINEDQSESALVYLHLLGDNEEIRGKMAFGKESYALKGSVSEDRTEVYFSVYNPEDGGFYESIGEFNGEIQRFDNFAVLRGSIEFETLSYPNQYWTLTVIGKENSIFEKEIIVAQSDGAPVTRTINKEEVVTIRQGHSTEAGTTAEAEAKEVYIVPEKIEKKKILGIIPNPWGEKILKVKLIEGDTITEERVKEFGTNKIGDYQVSVGSLENEDAIEVSVTQSN
ncbi:MAG: hypothetical protein ABH864_02115 [archaeon]